MKAAPVTFLSTCHMPGLYRILSHPPCLQSLNEKDSDLGFERLLSSLPLFLTVQGPLSVKGHSGGRTHALLGPANKACRAHDNEGPCSTRSICPPTKAISAGKDCSTVTPPHLPTAVLRWPRPPAPTEIVSSLKSEHSPGALRAQHQTPQVPRSSAQ